MIENSPSTVLLSMSRFSQITYDADSQTAIVGAGLLWEEVYDALLPHGVTVVGGRISGVGVAGLLLGGGTSNPCSTLFAPDLSEDRLLLSYESVWACI